MRGPSSPILLDAWAARSCPVKTQNAFDPHLSEPVGHPRDDELFSGAQAHVTAVCDAFAAIPSAVDVRSRASSASRRAATHRATDAGAPVIVCPELPSSPHGHRSGSPDALILAGTRADGGPGYLPVIVKDYLVLESHHTLAEFTWVSPLDDPDPRHATMSLDQTFRPSRERALIQAAHHWRLLDDLGLVATPDQCPNHRRLVGLVGHDELGVLDDALAVSWLDLDHKFIRTFSRSAASGWRRRSVLDRYDHEQTFRVSVAEHALAGGEPMVAPIVVPECESCQWWAVCEPRLDDDDLSLRISKAPLDVREISTLRRLGVATVDDLADANLDDLLPVYLPEVQHRPRPEQRLRAAARRARLIREGVLLERNDDDPIDVPASRLEIDFDIETSPDGRVYLWGFEVSDPERLLDSTTDADPYYVSFSDFSDMDDAAEHRLASRAIQWLDSVIAAHPETIVVHYSDYEIVHLRHFGRVFEDDSSAVQRLLDSGCFVDLFTTIRAHFFGVNGIGLKVVATAGAGFSWRDPDPGGLNSQTWWNLAVHDPDPTVREASRTRVLEYNEDDVRATLAVRHWLRDQYSSTSAA
ncbi:TM0106 family RecB-like putative nuclease [Cutibacterium sp. WCA-380-WT-3A]|uniref:TM0106 family RecB-like putative nuclease n=1 Tax=Cutibacterium porci TaxID=2605781 RepID=A0A7K0J8B1_9ACTN|nr:TM0106 family RecB-like putative nuclease [Cutibacterium porci]MSS46185.1 TM0106 family RecB-like putative nuclease [Cutibacterium porci]